MNCCNHNCREGRDCPDRAVVTPEEAESWVLPPLIPSSSTWSRSTRTARPSLPALADNSPASLMLTAMRQGALDQIEKMMDLQARWEATEARKAYNAAFSEFKAEAVRIVKNKLVTAGPLQGKSYAELHCSGGRPHPCPVPSRPVRKLEADQGREGVDGSHLLPAACAGA
jgi:hypothetical protein